MPCTSYTPEGSSAARGGVTDARRRSLINYTRLRVVVILAVYNGLPNHTLRSCSIFFYFSRRGFVYRRLSLSLYIYIYIYGVDVLARFMVT